MKKSVLLLQKSCVMYDGSIYAHALTQVCSSYIYIYIYIYIYLCIFAHALTLVCDVHFDVCVYVLVCVMDICIAAAEELCDVRWEYLCTRPYSGMCLFVYLVMPYLI